jgi:hypothetical protein
MTDLRQYLGGLPVFTGELPGFDPAKAPQQPDTLFTDNSTEMVRSSTPAIAGIKSHESGASMRLCAGRCDRGLRPVATGTRLHLR